MPAGERKEEGHPLGIHRVLDKNPQLPQAAERLDNSLPIYSEEILISVEKLNIDAASFIQMEEEAKKDPQKISEIVMQNCKTRGKQQNRVTHSGGILMGKVIQVGRNYKGPIKLKKNDRVASLVSLTLTPLNLKTVKKVHLKTHQMEVEGHAILFESSILALLPKDIEEAVALAVYDVAGAPATVNAVSQKGKTLIVIGAGGKAGLLSCVAGRQKIGKTGKLIAIEPFEKSAAALNELNVCDDILSIDATDPIAILAGVQRATRGKMGDIVINVASVPNTETGTLLSVKKTGTVVFFSMATSFTKVALGAEGIASEATLLFGNGYYPNHAKFALDLLRKNKPLKELFYRRFH